MSNVSLGVRKSPRARRSGSGGRRSRGPYVRTLRRYGWPTRGLGTPPRSPTGRVAQASGRKRPDKARMWTRELMVGICVCVCVTRSAGSDSSYSELVEAESDQMLEPPPPPGTSGRFPLRPPHPGDFGELSCTGRPDAADSEAKSGTFGPNLDFRASLARDAQSGQLRAQEAKMCPKGGPVRLRSRCSILPFPGTTSDVCRASAAFINFAWRSVQDTLEAAFE